MNKVDSLITMSVEDVRRKFNMELDRMGNHPAKDIITKLTILAGNI